MRHAFTLRLGKTVHLPLSMRFTLTFLVLFAVLAGSIFLALRFGSTPITNHQIFAWFFSSLPASDTDTPAIMLLRWPRIAAAVLSGAMISVSGYILQIVSRNGLADPGLLGISQGTMAAVVIGAVVFQVPSAWLSFVGLGGGLATGAIVLFFAFRLSSANGLILIGLAIGIVLGAFIEILMIQGGILQFSRWMTWSHGSLTAVSIDHVRTIFLWAFVLFPIVIASGRNLMPLLLGGEQAAALGANPKYLLPLLTLLSAALVAPVVATLGPISFLGLIGAHVARRLVGERPGEVLPISMLTGSCILLWADTIGRTLFLPAIVPAGIVVSLAGIVIFLIVSRLSRP
jgi:iron complex transport system permease protein